eukprot:GILJ01007810.1.p1 GENE.GILJ01007810.1~~GILJ01007810.1.p1  ORF type:complete len:713 (-),score=185.21 GILJ01007810.1:80-2158(-)
MSRAPRSVDDIASLRKQITDLQLQVMEKNKQLQIFEAGDAGAEAKIRALNNLHSQKVRALMNSINELKKQVASLRLQGKDHKRSQLIDRLQHEITEQDQVIEAFKDYIRDEAVCDKIIMTALNKGPQMIRPAARQELKKEIMLLKKKLDAKTAQLENVKSAPVPAFAVDSVQQQDPSEQASTTGDLSEERELELLEEIEGLKVEIAARDHTLGQQQANINQLHEDLRVLKDQADKSVRSEAKRKTLEGQLQGLRDQIVQLTTEKEKYQDDATRFKTESQNVQQQLQSLRKETQNERAKWLSDMKTLQAEITTLQSGIADATLATSETKQQIYGAKKGEMETLEKKYGDLKTRHDSLVSQVTGYQNQIAELTDRLDQVTQSYKSLKAAASQSQTTNSNNNQTNNKSNAGDNSSKRKDNVHQQEEEQTSDPKLSVRFKELEQEIEQLHAEVEEEKQTNQQLATDKRQLEATIKRLQRSLAESETSGSVGRTRPTSAGTGTGSRAAVAVANNRALEMAESKLAETEEKLFALQVQFKELMQKDVEATQELDDLKHQLGSIQNQQHAKQILSIRTNKTTGSSGSEDYKALYEKATSQLKAEQQAHQKQVHELKNAIANLEAEIQDGSRVHSATASTVPRKSVPPSLPLLRHVQQKAADKQVLKDVSNQPSLAHIQSTLTTVVKERQGIVDSLRGVL